ncbi:MAG: MFS transporter [Anaerolineales bacterium]|nr:MFS transporter [Anaerolineales bacterium]
MAAQAVMAGSAHSEQQGLPRIIFASAAGTMIEWYDFYIFGSLATVISSKFYQTGTPLGDLIAWLAAFAVGFIVRPFGAIVFGRVGDLIGRKYTFLVTMTLMGLCTFAVGLLPTAEVIGPAAGIILILLRILQGLALGGEYGGAATYVAEHAPQNRRGYFTSWIQITATLGLFVSLGVILTTRSIMGEEAFAATGWRIPFLISIFLVGLSLYIRYSLRESPLYIKLKEKKQVSTNPLKESFGNPLNLSYVLLALFGATMGQGVVWYTGQFYALFYLQKIFGVGLVDSNMIIGAALLAGTPFFVLVGHLSDKYGRKPFMLWGMVLGFFTWLPIYQTMARFAPFIGNPADKVVNPAYSPFMLGVLVFIQVIYVTLAYGPIAAFLVELFPTKIRYTSMSLPYHIGNGVFGGLVPIIGLSLIQATGNNFAGLWYPMAIAGICAVVGYLKLPETNHVDIASDHSIASIRVKGVAASGRRILVPLDGSPISETILDHARKLAKADGAELVLLQVANSAGEIFNDPSIAADDLNAAASADKSYMETLLARMKSEGVLASVEVREGPVAETILAVAKEMNVDMIAMSTHGRSGLQKLLMGSVTEWMVKHSPVPVLVIRPQDG